MMDGLTGIVTLDAHGCITLFNPGAAQITGRAVEESLGQPADEVFKLASDSGHFSSLVSADGVTRRMNVLAHAGRVVTLAVTGIHLAASNGQDGQIALILQDITQEEAIQGMRAYFLSNISHEFRTPLSAISASLELLLDELPGLSTAEIWELLNSIHRSVTGLQALIDNLLESSRIEAGRFSIRRCPGDLNQIVAEALRMTGPLLERRQQELSVIESAQPETVHVDPTRLTQVLVNLLSNASKYSPVGQPIELSIEPQDGAMLRIAVADRGPGISPADRANLFRRFVRLDTQDGTQYGVGLGLSVVKAIVEQHGGNVGVDERPGGGSIFWFTLPLRDGESDERADRG